MFYPIDKVNFYSIIHLYEFKEFFEDERKEKASLVLGILSIILGLLSPVVSLILGIIGLVLANSHQKESGLDYKIEKNLSILGIVISALHFILGVMVFIR